MKLRFWPTDGKHLNPAVRGVLFAVVLGFLAVMVYGVMSRGGKKKAADAAKDDQSITDAQSTGTKVWKDLEEQRKLDARKEAQNQSQTQAQPASNTADVIQDHVQSAGVPACLLYTSNEQNNPVPGPDGRVVYTFGVGQPTLVATPLRVSSIELQAGEKILGEPQIGDSVRCV